MIIKNFKMFEKTNDPYGEEIWDDDDPINIPDIYNFYFNHHTHYSVFNGNNYEVRPMERRENYACPGHRYNGVVYLGLREAGNFFAYGRKYVWVLISNNGVDKVRRTRADRGFHITITTVDDSALYADWDEPITEEKLEKVVEYFDFYTELDTNMNILNDISDIIGIKYSDFDLS